MTFPIPKRLLLTATVLMFFAVCSALWARGGGGHSGGHSGGHGSGHRKTLTLSPHRSSHMGGTMHRAATGHFHGQKSKYALGVARDSHGRIQRSSAARHEFMAQTGYPHGRPGYVIDHIVPLKRGGADSPTNMQWQSKAAAKAKDRWE